MGEWLQVSRSGKVEQDVQSPGEIGHKTEFLCEGLNFASVHTRYSPVGC